MRHESAAFLAEWVKWGEEREGASNSVVLTVCSLRTRDEPLHILFPGPSTLQNPARA